MRRAVSPILIFVSFFFLESASSRVVQAADAKIDISGRWTINEGLSDNPFEKMHEARGSGGSRGGGGEGGGGSRGGWGHGGGSGGGSGGGRGRGRRDEGGDSGKSIGEDLLEETRQLVIVQKDPELRITTLSGRERLLYLDGRKTKQENDEGTITTKTKWKGTTIVVDTEFPSGREVVATYELLPQIRHLVVTMKISPPKGRSFSFRRVYDPADEPTAAPKEEAPASSPAPPATKGAPESRMLAS